MSIIRPVTLRVNRVYDRATVQGEGPHTGRRCTFVRLWGCNLHCAWCDSAETWDTKGLLGTVYERGDNMRELSVDRVAELVQAVGVDMCVITGGEPMVQAQGLAALAHELDFRGIEVHVETNGTRSPLDPTQADYLLAPALRWVRQWVVSPKLLSAEAGRAEVPESLEAWARASDIHPDRVAFKFVCSDLTDLGEVDAMVDRYRIMRRQVWVMPEATNAAAVDVGLQVITDSAVLLGYNVSTRLHVQVWGSERGR